VLAQYPLGYEGDDVVIDVTLDEFDIVEPKPLGQVRAGDEP